MSMGKHVRKSRKDRPQVKRTAKRSIAHYPRGVETDEDKQEYDTYLAGLPLVNQIFFGHNLSKFKKWVSEDCPVGVWQEIKDALRNVASYIAGQSDAGQPERKLAATLVRASQAESPDSETMKGVLSSIFSWAQS